MNILALDVATHTGWCTKTTSGVWDLTPKRDQSMSMRLIKMKAFLRELVSLETIDLIVFERSQGQHQSSVIIQSELHGVLKLFCEESNIPYKAYSPKEIKKFATGTGNANKKAMIEAAKEKYGYQGNDDNEADAIHIFKLASHEFPD